MTKKEFLQRFHLSSLKTSSYNNVEQAKFSVKNAAVLVPLIEKDDELFVLLTLRASHLSNHADQISFPGGKVDAADKNDIDTALREANEEIGLPYGSAQILGKLHYYHTNSGFKVTPIIATLAIDVNYQANRSEVAEIFQVPLKHFLNLKNHHTIMATYQGHPQQVTFIPYQHYNIWGVTAAILRDLAMHLSPENF
jgi:8-oxo-dGTP pyrophosphatase MutT (NUDIX family)